VDEHRPRKRRLFAGVALDDAARSACASVSEALLQTGFAAKYESPNKLHVTLAFLGFVEPSRFGAIAAALATCARDAKSFSVTLDKLGAFPHERRPRVVFVGAREQGTRFRELAANVRAAYAELGFSFADDPVAHVTIARVKESRRPLPLIEFAPITLEITSLSLFESLPDPEHRTSRYEIAASKSL
jgi:RNA 2',3'-cyclic 3'-phosphodiesterase